MDIDNFYKDIDKQTVLKVKSSISKEEYKEFIANLKVVLKIYKKYSHKTSSKIYESINNEAYSYFFEKDVMMKEYVGNWDEYEFRRLSYIEATPKKFKQSYNFCKTILEKVFQKDKKQNIDKELTM